MNRWYATSRRAQQWWDVYVVTPEDEVFQEILFERDKNPSAAEVGAPVCVAF